MIRPVVLAMLVPGTLFADAIQLPATAEISTPDLAGGLHHDLPAGPWRQGSTVFRTYDGVRTDRVARLEPGQSVDQMTDQLLGTLNGYRVIYDCTAAQCGGFDFRFALTVAPEPEMHVDISDYRYVLAEAGEEAVALLVSRSKLAGFVQITEVTGDRSASPAAEGQPTPLDLAPPLSPSTALVMEDKGANGTIVSALLRDGHAVLEDLTFATGSAELGTGPFDSLDELSAWMTRNPAISIGIVGHTDAVGSLEGNIGLSKRRAESVAARLTDSYGLNAGRIEALGAGYLAPRATNQTESGRQSNRRVEVILTSVE